MSRFLTARRALVVALGVHAVLAAISFVRADEPATDFDRYHEIATSSTRPYVDDPVEHPIGTVITFRGVATAAPGRASFGRAVVALNAAADAAIVCALAWTWSLPAAAYYAVVAAPLSGLLFNRIDLWSTAAATLAIAAWRRRRYRAAAFGLAVGASLKLWPAVFGVALLVPRARSRSAPAMLLASAAALAAAVLMVAGLRGILDVLTFRGARGWQIESVVGSVMHLIGAGRIRLESGSWRIGTMSGATSMAMFAAAAPLCLWCSWRGFASGRVGAAWLAAISWLLLLSALLSAQFIGWLIPGAAIAWAERERRLAILTACCVVLTLGFWTAYEQVLASAPLALALVVVRNVVLLLLAIDATAALRSALPGLPGLPGLSGLDADLQADLAGVRVVEGAERR